MIHYTKEGEYVKIGLNFCFLRGGFRVIWAWYNFATTEATAYRFRFRAHIKPRIICEKQTWNVYNQQLSRLDMIPVAREVFEDLMLTQRDMVTYHDRHYYVKPNGQSH